MRNCVVLVFLCSILLGVNSQSPLQIDPDEYIAKHSHGNSGESKEAFSGNAKIRLPKNVLPIHYDLEIIPILDELVPPSPERTQFTAPGKVTILVRVDEATDNIILHKHKNLTIHDDLKVTDVANPPNLIVATSEENLDQELYIINLDQTLTVGSEYEIFVSFIAPVDNHGNNNGLYLSSYINPVTKLPSYIATTQFEAASARQAFPCFDEPGIKANFTIKIGYNKANYKALGNTGYVDGRETPLPDYGADWVLQEFEETVPMSSYLVAIVVADFEYEQAPDGIYPGKPVRIYGAPHLMKNDADESTGGVFSAHTSARLLKFFEDYYEIEYHLSKMDSVAVGDFNFGAMENWGLNIYRQEYLLFHDGVSTENDRKRITSVLSHELAHQWFGNSVTTEWWSFIWLNEGFATYNEYLGAQVVEPDFLYEQVSVNENLQVGLFNDALANTHPLVNSADPNDPNDKLMVFFDRITYQKGGAVILMMEGFLGKETFKRALINYLKGMEFKGANQDHLFQFLTEQAHADNKISQDITMKDIMETWTLQSGFPLVRVSRAGSSRIYISQERFTNGGPIPTHELGPNDLWYVPLAIATADNPDFSNHTPAVWLDKDTILKSVNLDASQWVMVNPDATGYYRVLYDTALTNLIVEQLNADFEVISDASRSQLIDDYFTFATEKYIQVETALQLTRYLTSERKMVVWTPVLKHLRVFLNKLSGTSSAFDEFRQYILPRITAALAVVGKEQVPGEKGWKVILRAQLLDWACSLGQTDCREYAGRLFADWNASPETNIVPVDIRPVVHCGAVSHGGVDNYQFAKGQYINEKNRPEQTEAGVKLRVLLLNSLACTELVEVVDELLGEVKKDETTSFLLTSDKGPLLQRLAANAESRPFVITFLRQELSELFLMLPSSDLASVVSTLATYVGTQTELEGITELVDPKYDTLWGEKDLPTVKGHIRTIEQNVAWRNEYDERLKEWFSSNK